VRTSSLVSRVRKVPLRCARAHTPVLVLAAAPVSLLGCGSSSEPAKATGRRTPVPVSAVATPDDGQWLMASKDYANNRFSGLSEINSSNVRNLQLAWRFSTGVLRGHEGAPLVVGGTMYFVTACPNILYALNLKNGGAKKWEYKPKPSSAS
jgi:glucose dehydrogenase